MSEDSQPATPSIPEDKSSEEAIIEKLTKVDPKVFEGISKDKKERIIHSFAVIQKTHIGPLPDPETFAKYAELIPNGADRIMTMAENQANHRMKMEAKVISGQLLQSNIGQFLAFFIGISALVVSGYCISNGHEWGGGIIGSAGIVGLVTAFIQGRKRQTINLIEKRPPPAKPKNNTLK